MIMPRGSDQLLLPVNPFFLWVSLLIALLINIVPLGVMAARPDVLALVLLFWAMQQPRRIGIGWGFLFGLLMDVHDGSLLGQHALAYSVLCFLGVSMHRRVQWFGPTGQMAQVAPIFLLCTLLTMGVRLLAGDGFPGWGLFLAPLIQTILWPIANAILLAPQRRPPDRDENRPI